jgi:hypothetical protein
MEAEEVEEEEQADAGEDAASHVAISVESAAPTGSVAPSTAWRRGSASRDDRLVLVVWAAGGATEREVIAPVGRPRVELAGLAEPTLDAGGSGGAGAGAGLGHRALLFAAVAGRLLLPECCEYEKRTGEPLEKALPTLGEAAIGIESFAKRLLASAAAGGLPRAACANHRPCESD